MRSLIFLTCVLWLDSASAADPFACVDPQVRNAFLNGYSRGVAYTDEMSPSIKPMRLPSEWRLLASWVDGRSEASTFMIQGSVEEGLRQAAQAVEQEGWSVLKGDGWEYSRVGFMSRASVRGASFCNAEDNRTLTISSQPKPDRVHVSMSFSSRYSQCAEDAQNRTAWMGRSQTMMPSLQIKPQRGLSVRGQGSGGNGESYRSNVVVEGEFDRQQILDDLQRQIAEQEWTEQVSWDSDGTSGSAWIRTERASGKTLTYAGTLEAFSLDDGSMAIRFVVSDLAALASR
ncbi:MAG: hypothetical protein AAGI88_03120 [Pseudomonadota bacterium]